MEDLRLRWQRETHKGVLQKAGGLRLPEVVS
jgi:hypothetical protein